MVVLRLNIVGAILDEILAENLLNDYYRLQHEYNIYDNEDNLIYRYLFNKDTYYDENQTSILLTIDDFCIYFKKIIKKLK